MGYKIVKWPLYLYKIQRGIKERKSFSQKSTSYPHPVFSDCAMLISRKPLGMSRNFLKKNEDCMRNKKGTF